MSERETEELREQQLERERAEAERARQASGEAEVTAHERRAEKASYLREKLEERAESERERAD